MALVTPLTCWNTPCTPQKQPPANTAVPDRPSLGASIVGAGTTTAASLECAGVFCHQRARGNSSVTASSLGMVLRNRSVKNATVSPEDITLLPSMLTAGMVETRRLMTHRGS